jgi:hypothetical protein
MFMFRQQAARQNHCTKVTNKYLKNVAKFKYLGTTVRNKNRIHTEIMSGFNSGSACYHSILAVLATMQFWQCLLPCNSDSACYHAILAVLATMQFWQCLLPCNSGSACYHAVQSRLHSRLLSKLLLLYLLFCMGVKLGLLN